MVNYNIRYRLSFCTSLLAPEPEPEPEPEMAEYQGTVKTRLLALNK